MTAKLPAISPRSPKMACDLPAISRECHRDLSAISRETRANVPPPPKGGEYKAIRTGLRGSSLCVLSDEIAALARRVRRLSVSHRHPERFHEEKSEIEHQLHCLARALHPNPTKG